MRLHRVAFPALLLVAGFALWLLLAGPAKLLGVDAGQAGTALLITAAWVSLYAIHRLPRGERERAISPGEWKAWLGTAFTAAAIAYFLSKLHVFAAAALPHNPAAIAVGRNLALLLIAWPVLSGVLGSRWKGEVEEDERDREIARNAGRWGRGALTFCIIVLAVTLAFSPPDRLQWATQLMIANQLILALMWGCLFGYAASAVYYWRDRVGAEA
jgi:uncharacterized membrane protein YidH (DUF202 family)